MAVEIRPALVEHMLLGPPDGRRRMQDLPPSATCGPGPPSLSISLSLAGIADSQSTAPEATHGF
jgi:hypothetical protein